MNQQLAAVNGELIQCVQEQGVSIKRLERQQASGFDTLMKYMQTERYQETIIEYPKGINVKTQLENHNNADDNNNRDAFDRTESVVALVELVYTSFKTVLIETAMSRFLQYSLLTKLSEYSFGTDITRRCN